MSTTRTCSRIQYRHLIIISIVSFVSLFIAAYWQGTLIRTTPLKQRIPGDAVAIIIRVEELPQRISSEYVIEKTPVPLEYMYVEPFNRSLDMLKERMHHSAWGSIPASMDGSNQACEAHLQLRVTTAVCVPATHLHSVSQNTLPVLIAMTLSDRDMPHVQSEFNPHLAPERVAVSVRLLNESSFIVARCQATLYRGRGSCSLDLHNVSTINIKSLVAVLVDSDGRDKQVDKVCIAVKSIAQCSSNRESIVVSDESLVSFAKKWQMDSREGKRRVVRFGPNMDIVFQNGINVCAYDLTVVFLPGTHVYLSKNARIRLFNSSQLIAAGTLDSPVLFTSTTNEGWGCIESTESTSIVFMHTLLTNGGSDRSLSFGHSNSQPVLRVHGSHLSILGGGIVDCAGKAVGSTNSHVVLRDVLISRVDQGGEFVQSRLDMMRCHVLEIPNDTEQVEDDDNDGVYVRDAYKPVGALRVNTFASEEIGLKLQRSRIVASVFARGDDDAIDQNGGFLEVRSSIISSFVHEGVATSGKSPSQVWIRDSLVEHCEQGIEVGYDSPKVSVEGVVVQHCRVGIRVGDSYASPPFAAYRGSLRVVRSIVRNCSDFDILNHVWKARLAQKGPYQGVLLLPHNVAAELSLSVGDVGSPLQEVAVLCSTYDSTHVFGKLNYEFAPNKQWWWFEARGGEVDEDWEQFGSASTTLITAHSGSECDDALKHGSRWTDISDTPPHDRSEWSGAFVMNTSRLRYPLGPRYTFRRHCPPLPWLHGTGTKGELWMGKVGAEGNMHELLGVLTTGSGNLKPNALIRTNGGLEAVLHGSSNRYLHKLTGDSVPFSYASLLELLSYLSHPVIVRPLFLCVNDTDQSYVEAYVDSVVHNASAFDEVALRSVRKTGGAYALLKVCLQLARAIAYLHQSAIGCVRHGDVKAQNILLVPAAHVAGGEDRVFLIDWDTAQLAAHSRAPLRLAASICHSKSTYSFHISPECNRPNVTDAPMVHIDAMGDVYALCQRLYTVNGALSRERIVQQISIHAQFHFNNESLAEYRIPWHHLLSDTVDTDAPGLVAVLKMCLEPFPEFRSEARWVAERLEEIVNAMDANAPVDESVYPPYPEKPVSGNVWKMEAVARWTSSEFEQPDTSDMFAARALRYERATQLNAFVTMDSWHQFVLRRMSGDRTNVTKYEHSYLKHNASVCGVRNVVWTNKVAVAPSGGLRRPKSCGNEPPSPMITRFMVKSLHANNSHFDDESGANEALASHLDRLLGTFLIPPTFAMQVWYQDLRKDFPHLVDIPSIQCVLLLDGRVFGSAQVMVDNVESVLIDKDDVLFSYVNWREYVLFHYVARCGRSSHNHFHVVLHDGSNDRVLLMIDNDRCFTKGSVVSMHMPEPHRLRYTRWERLLRRAICYIDDTYTDGWRLVLRSMRNASYGDALRRSVRRDQMGWFLLQYLVTEEIFSELDERVMKVNAIERECVSAVAEHEKQDINN